jgi:phosphoribosylaminoimidazole-succinocarboxamide synthase
MKRQTQLLPGETEGLVGKSANQTLISNRQGKFLYQSDKPDQLIQVFHSNGTENGKKKPKPQDVDILRNQISAYLFEYLEGYHIPTHFIGRLGPAEMIVKWLETIPLAVRIYNNTHPELMARLGYPEATHLEYPVIEHQYSDGKHEPTWVNEFHVYALGIATPEEFKQINRIASKVNAVLRGLCDRRSLQLAEVELEFGRFGGQVLLGSELSPMTCRFYDCSVPDPAQRDRFRLTGDNPVPALTELCDRLMLKV